MISNFSEVCVRHLSVAICCHCVVVPVMVCTILKQFYESKHLDFLLKILKVEAQSYRPQ